jgi:hypothetical protein
MSTLDEITKEKQRVGEVLARVDAQRDQLVSQLRELEATERVIARTPRARSQGRRPQPKCPPR